MSNEKKTTAYLSDHTVNACGSSGKSATQKNPAIKAWIAENKKMVGVVLIVRKMSLKFKMVASVTDYPVYTACSGDHPRSSCREDQQEHQHRKTQTVITNIMGRPEKDVRHGITGYPFGGWSYLAAFLRFGWKQYNFFDFSFDFQILSAILWLVNDN